MKRRAEWKIVDISRRVLKLPKVLQFFTGNIGLHHVHHLSARIPNYNLQAAHDNIDLFDDVPVLTIRDGFKAVRFKLWDERSGRMVGFGEARRQRRAAANAKAKPAFETAG